MVLFLYFLMSQFHLLFYIAQLFTDYLLILSAFALAYFFRIGFFFSTDFPFSEYFIPALIVSLGWLFVLHFSRAYHEGQDVLSLRHAQRLVFVSLVGVSAYVITFFFLRKEIFSRLIIVLIFVFSVVLVWLAHYFFSRLKKHFYSQGKGVRRTLIIGVNRETERLVEKLKKERSIYFPVGILDAYGSKQKELSGVPVLGKLNKFEESVRELKVDCIIQTDNLEQVINIMNFALHHNISYALLPSLLGAYRKKQYIEEIEGIPVVRIK